MMTSSQFTAFEQFRNDFHKKVAEWSRFAQTLAPLQKRAAQSDTPEYPLETCVVYNRALDDVTQDGDIKLIVIGDNPGKDEQRACNNRYLVGQSGKLADGFFHRNSALGIDFRKNVIILNKTPVHTAKTKHLRTLQKDKKIAQLILESQVWMAEHTAQLHQALVAGALRCEDGASQHADVLQHTERTTFMPREMRCNAKIATVPQLWLVGYAELKKGGIFTPYRDALKSAYVGKNGLCAWQNVFVYQHFSMNCFSIDLKRYLTRYDTTRNTATLSSLLAELGTLHRDEIFGAY